MYSDKTAGIVKGSEIVALELPFAVPLLFNILPLPPFPPSKEILFVFGLLPIPPYVAPPP